MLNPIECLHRGPSTGYCYREDNADLRLTEIGKDIGLASSEAHRRLLGKETVDIDDLMGFLDKQQIPPTEKANSTLTSFASAPLRDAISLCAAAPPAEISIEQIRIIAPDMPIYARDVDAQVEIQIKYEGYVNRQMEIVERFQKIENLKLLRHLDYADINGLSKEAREKLANIRPRSLGQASRISGITPAGNNVIVVCYLKKRKSA